MQSLFIKRAECYNPLDSPLYLHICYISHCVVISWRIIVVFPIGLCLSVESVYALFI